MRGQYGYDEDQGPGLILNKIIELRKAVGGLKSEKKDGVRFKVKSAAVLMGKIREAADNLSLTICVGGMDITDVPVQTGTMCMVRARVDVVALDGSFISFYGAGHGADTSDKAGGKASTYSWKDALVKGLCMPDADMDDTDDDSEQKPVRGAAKAAAPSPDAGASAEPPAKVKEVVARIETLTDLKEIRDFARAAAEKFPEHSSVFQAAYTAAKERLK